MSLRADNVSVHYGSTPALDGLSFAVESGETVGLVGSAGAGKTSLMRVLAGFVAPSAGTVFVMGRDPSLPAARSGVGYLPEHNPLPSSMRAGEYLAFRARLRGLGRRQTRAAVAEAAERCRAADLLDGVIGRLPAWPRLRIGLAETLLAGPSVLLLDGPTAGLDPEQAAEVRALLRSLPGSVTLFLSSGLLRDVREACGRMIVLERGRVLADGPVGRICDDGLDERRLSLEIIADEPIREALRGIPGVKAVQVLEGGGEPNASTVRLTMPVGVDLRREISALCARRGWLATEMRLEPATLDDVVRRFAKGA